MANIALFFLSYLSPSFLLLVKEYLINTYYNQATIRDTKRKDIWVEKKHHHLKNIKSI